MRLSTEQIKNLQGILKKQGLNYSSEQAQDAGMAILRFVLVKAHQNKLLIKYTEVQDETIITRK